MAENVHFVKDGKSYQVQEWKDSEGWDWNTLGTLEFDSEQNAWVLWMVTASGDEGVTYWDSLEESKKDIIEDLTLN